MTIGQATADLLAGGGEMAARMREFDWSATSLGQPTAWPAPLRAALRLILRSAHPAVILWGPDFHCLYNDAFARSLGPEKHPAMLGTPASGSWTEAWPVIGTDIERVRAEGISLFCEDRMVPMLRHGHVDTAYWTYSISPIEGDADSVGGVLLLCAETTGRVLETQRRDTDRARQEKLFEQAPGFIILMRGPDHIVEFVNDAHRSLFGSDDWVGKTIRRAFPSIEGQGFFRLLDQVYAQGETHSADGVPLHFRREPGGAEEVRYVTFIYAPLFSDDGEVSGVFCEGFDVTRSRHAEVRHAALSEFADRLRDTSNPGDIAAAAAETLARTLGVSRAGYATVDIGSGMVQVERDWSMPGIRSLAGEQWMANVDGRIEALAAGEAIVVADIERDPRTATAIERLRALDTRAFVNLPVTEEGGVVALLFLNHLHARAWSEDEVALIREVAERTRGAIARREAEQALEHSEARLRLAIDGARIGTWDWDLKAMKATWSDRTIEIFGPGSETLLHLEQRYMLVHPEDRDRVRDAFGRSIASGEPFFGEYRIVTTTGVTRWVASRGLVLRDDAGRPARAIGTVRDVTHRRETQDRLTALNETLEQQVAERTAERDRMWRLSGDLFLVVGLRGEVRAANPALASLLGYAADQVVGERLTRFVHPDDLAAITRALRATSQGPVRDLAVRLRASDGNWRRFAFSAAPGEGEAYVIGRDVTDEVERREELERAQEALRQSQKMESLGQLTGGVAHDFNNLLTPIIGSLDLLRRKLDGPRDRRLIDAALESAERARTLVQRLLAFARRQPLQPGPVDVARLIHGMSELVASTSGPQIALAVDIAEPLPPARADANQLEMAILNLAVNARDAMPAGGRLSIVAREERVEPGHRSGLQPGRYVRIAVSDTGTGMDSETMARAIEPFFSTKGIGKGTGLGLSMVHGLASQLGGAMLLSSRPGVGTAVELLLPVADAAPPRRVTQPGTGLSGGAGTVLLVDDEEPVRAATSALLSDLGYTVIEAPDAPAALRLLEHNQVDYLVTDHLMPGMTGTELAQHMRARFPDIAVLVVSGYADLDALSPDLPRIAKPFRQQELAAIMATL